MRCFLSNYFDLLFTFVNIGGWAFLCMRWSGTAAALAMHCPWRSVFSECCCVFWVPYLAAWERLWATWLLSNKLVQCYYDKLSYTWTDCLQCHSFTNSLALSMAGKGCRARCWWWRWLGWCQLAWYHSRLEASISSHMEQSSWSPSDDDDY